MSDATEDRKGGHLTDEALITILRQEEQQAANWQDSELQGIRTKALEYYDRKPIGDEEAGQSTVITSEFADTVESIMPSMMRVFASGEDVVEFTPTSKADEQWAREASQYVPHVLMRENDGFVLIHAFLKDALMYRLSGATVDLEEKDKTQVDQVESWTQMQIAAAVQILESKGSEGDGDDEPSTPPEITVDVKQDPIAPMADPMAAEFGPAEPTFSGTITCKHSYKCVKVDGIAPEDILISPSDARDIDEASFAGYRKQVTASQLRKLGLSQADIDALSDTRRISTEEDDRQNGQPQSRRQGSERRLWLVVAYVRADDNGDGISEMLRCVYAHAGGQNGKLIERMEWEEPEAPIALATPILMPHTIMGRSLFDQTEELQDVGTALTRGLLDNVYFSIRPRPAINKRVSVTSVLDWVPGMPIIVEGNENPNDAISWQKVPNIMGESLTALEHFQGVRENRTGVTRYNQGLDADSLNKTASGINNIMTASQQRQELIAKVFAATGVTRLMRLIYRAIKRSATGPISYYAKGDWQECDPTKWPDDMHLQVAVGTGTGNKQQELQNLMLLGAAQEKLVLAQGGTGAGPLTMDHLFNTVRKIAEAMGFRATEQFVPSARDVQKDQATPKEPQDSPEMAKVKADAAAQAAKQQSDMQLAQQKLAADIQLRREQAAVDMQLAREKAELDMQIERERAALNAELKRQEMALEAEIEAFRIKNEPKQNTLKQQEVQ